MIENNIIGLVLTGQLDPLTTGLEDKHFTNFAHKRIWIDILDTAGRKLTPDVITIADNLNRVDGDDWFTTLAVIAKDNIGSFSATGHIKQMKSLWVVNQVKDIGSRMANSDKQDVNSYIKELMSLDRTEKKYLHSFHEACDDALNEISNSMNGVTASVTTGFEDIDRLTGGYHNSDLIVIAARSAMGKTAFLLNTAAANKDRPLIFSTEMSRIQAAQRMFSIYGNVPNHLLRKGDIDDETLGKLELALNTISDSNGYIYDKSGPYMSEIESTAREVYNNHGCSAIYLDYLQRIKHENPKLPNHEKVGDIAMRLKELARELDIPVIALAQVNRNVETREDKRPNMGDIKDSGTIEQEADQIITIYRDEVYNDNSPDHGTAELTFKKNRHGGTGMIRTVWDAKTMRFLNMQRTYA